MATPALPRSSVESFLRRHAPFNAMSAPALDFLVPRLKLVYFPKDAVIVEPAAGAVSEAFHFLQMLRLRQQFSSPGSAPNRIDPDGLNEIDQRMLKEALRQARKLQERLKTHYQL